LRSWFIGHLWKKFGKKISFSRQRKASFVTFHSQFTIAIHNLGGIYMQTIEQSTTIEEEARKAAENIREYMQDFDDDLLMHMWLHAYCKGYGKGFDKGLAYAKRELEKAMLKEKSITLQGD